MAAGSVAARSFFHLHEVGRRQGRCGAVSRGDDDLAGVFLPEVSDDVNTRHIGFAFFIGDHISVGIELDARRYQLVVGDETDENEDAVGLQVPNVAGLGVLEPHGSDTVVI